MKKILALVVLGLAILPARAFAQIDGLNVSASVCKSSATVFLVQVDTDKTTLVDVPRMEGAFIVELQNRDASNRICCGFASDLSTSSSAAGNACREIGKNGDFWDIKRWWSSFRIYCQSLGTGAKAPVAVAQCR